jgi:hypothetical protein
MPKTIEGGPWDYLPVLNECIRILLTVAIGVLSGYLKAFDADTFVPQAIKFVFSVSEQHLLGRIHTNRSSWRLQLGSSAATRKPSTVGDTIVSQTTKFLGAILSFSSIVSLNTLLKHITRCLLSLLGLGCSPIANSAWYRDRGRFL